MQCRGHGNIVALSDIGLKVAKIPDIQYYNWYWEYDIFWVGKYNLGWTPISRGQYFSLNQ